MGNLKTLVLMQLKDKVDFSYLKSVKKTIFKVVLTLLKFGIITGIMWLAFAVISMLRLVSLQQGIPSDFFAVIFTIMFILSIVVCSFGLMKTLYVAKDNQLLLTFPANRTTVFTSKLIVYYIYELIRNTTYMLPLLVAYAIINAIPIYYFLWIIAIYFVITAIPVVIGALLSIPTMYVTNFIKQYKWLEYTLVVVVIASIVLGIISLIGDIPSNIDLVGTWGTTFWEVRDFLENFIKVMQPFYWVVIAVVGERYGVANILFSFKQILIVLGLLALILIVWGITYLFVRPLYFKMASSPFEYKKVKIKKEHKNKVRKPWLSSVFKDIILSYRTQEKFYGLVCLVFGLPIAILLLNKIYSAMDTRLSGTNMTIAFNILMILLIALSSNVNLAHVYSEEGASGYLLKTSPRDYLSILTTKLFVNFVCMTLSIIASIIIMCQFFGYGILNGILIFILIESVYVSHLLMSAESDIMNPQSAHYQTTGSHINNPNDIRSTIMSFLLSAITTFFVYFLISENTRTVWVKLMFVAILFLCLRVWLYINKIKVYFKEKQ